MRKRILSLLLCVVMLFSICPQSALAVGNEQTGGVTIGTSGLCEHHPAHDDECGYTEGTAGTPCSHEHTDDCYTEVTDCVHEHTEDCYPQNSVSGNNATSSNADEPTECTHVCSEESGCITKQLNCQHEHDEDCGYTPATAGTPCGYVCELCGGEDNGEAGKQPEAECICTTLCTTEAIEEDCPVCGVENADLTLCEGEAKTATPSNAEAITVALAADPVTDVSYLDETGTSQTCTSATEVTSSDTGWGTSGTTTWYVVQGTVIIGSRVTVSGDVHLILTDGCTLTVNGGIQVQDDDDDITNGSANALTIYAQSTDKSTMGKLIATGAKRDNNAVIGGNGGNSSGGSGGTITINGGTVTATSTDSGAAIGGGEGIYGGSGGEITINGGSVIATGVNGAGIGGGQGDGGFGDYGGSGGTITINGGSVIATGVNGAAIGGGYNGGGGTGGDGGKITITGGNTTASGYYCTAIGGGFGDYGGSGGEVTITGGTVTATGNASGQTFSSSAAGIGGGRYNFSSGSAGTFQTNNGNAVIFASSIGDQSHKDDWHGIIFEGDAAGIIYGESVAPTDDFTIPTGKTLTIPDGVTMTVNSRITVNGTLANNGTIIGSGSIMPEGKRLAYKAFPGAPVIASVSADSITLQPIIGETAVEYSKDNTNWQSGTTFSGLTAATSYTFYARYQANGFYKGASPQSDGSTPTYIAYYDGPAIVIGTDGISGYSDDGVYHFIYFGNWEAPDSNTTSGPIRWRVLDDQTNTGESGLFLLSDVLLGKGSRGGVYFDNTSRFSNAWQGSSAQAWCRDFAGESGAESNVNDAFTADELGVILSTSKSDAEFDSEHHTFCASENILSGDRVFFLSAEEAENDEYGFTDDAAQVANYGTSAGGWWLRSFPNEHDLPFAGRIGDRGRVGEEGVINPWAARPAFNLNTSSVLFTSVAAGGKADTAVDENLTAVGTGTGEWKLTLLDNSRKSFTASAGTGTALMQKPGYSDWTVSIDYSGAPTGANEYVSAILADESGTPLYYGRIVSSSASGTARVTIPAGLAPGSYTLKVFSEQYNGDKQTDYASTFENINLTVGYKEQFSLAPGSTYYFDLSGADIPGDKNGSLPDDSLHWVPFTYAGTVNAYVLKSRSANDNTAKGDSANAAGSTDPDNPIGYTYDHGLFIADYNVTRRADWNNLNRHNLIFGKAYTSSGVDYTLRVPSAGSGSTGSMDSERGTPLNNEWDAILDKANQSYQDNTVGYIKNWNGMYSWGQDTQDGPDPDWNRATRGSFTARSWQFDLKLSPSAGFRPVLELPSSDTLGSDGLKAITLDLNGGKLGGSADDIQIIVKNGAAFTAPASDGLTRPDGDTGDYFKWLGSDGNLYAPGKSVPAGVTTLTAQFAVPSYTVTLNTNGGTINSGNVTGYTYGQGATLPTADDITRAGHTFEGWYEDENFSGSPVTEISATDTGKKEFYAKWTLNTYTVTFDSQGGSKVDSQAVSHGGTVTEPTAPTYEGYTFGGWYTEAGCTTEYDFTTAVTESLTLYAKWKDVTCPTGEITVDKSKWNMFFNNITFGLFFKDTQKVTITASDNSGDNVTITYLLSDKELTVDELNVSVFTAYTGAFYIEPNNEYVIYAKLTDSSGNICYINSNGVVLDNVDPLISGIIDGKTYCEAQTVTIDEKYVDNVTVDGTAVTLTDGKFTLSPADGKQTIVVTDEAGNKAEMAVTVNDGHTGGTATCTEKAKCEVCGTAYGEINANNHTDLKHIKAKAATKNAEGNIEYWYCEDCGKYFSDADAKNEITKAATVIAKLTDDTKSPQTGDNSHMVLWFALLFVSCGGVITTIYIGKRKKDKAE